ncbi:PR domain zinc finger protein 5-like [Neocloeon triangulifer]|uniref:PR domain zinc finger protein 5-like n=1 Tax=Neocloeon triangulifer TaxID=2078957 RepID=UPI00286F643F|nr:PR domain zinc finger protein 5-like [Neocloeon triangulifer]
MRPELCRLCERPAAEGGYRGAELDLEALAEWCLNYLGTTLADEVKDEDLFCFFCVWDARFLRETLNGPESELIPCWWPDEKTKDTKPLSYALFKAGNIQQCWVTLQKLPSDESSLQNYNEIEPKEYDLDKTKFQCIYCIKSFLCKYKKNRHIKENHGTIAICCNFNLSCRSYFLTVEERDLHIKEFHLKPKVPVLQNCIYCQRNGLTRKGIWQHVRKKHADVAFMCPYMCAKYFKSENELKIHLETQHKGIEERKKFKCSMCSYRSQRRDFLTSHEVKVHQKLVPLSFKCLRCPAKFISNAILKRHISYVHQYRDCPSCKKRITVGSVSQHFQIVPCRFCKIKFNCRGLLRDHNLKCGISFSCAFCLKVFEQKSSLQYHLIRNHLQVKGLRFKDRGHKCKICSIFLSSRANLKRHVLMVHS